MVGERVRSAMAAGAAAARALGGVPGGLARRGVPFAGRVASAAPHPRLAVERYRTVACAYDVRTTAGDVYRSKTVQRLAPRPGDVVLDVGCGTGLNFARLEDAVGPIGTLAGIDLSPEMLDEARARVDRHGLHNVLLIQAAAESPEIPARTADAALLFCGVHDVMRSPAAPANVLHQVRDRGRVVAAGAKWAPWWQPGSAALNLSTWTVNRHYVTTFEGFDRPWTHLAGLVADLEVEEVYAGGGYIASGTWRSVAGDRPI